nr:PREDICTED: protein-glutamine gamma-glutamyltransferase 2-like [Paralichthys olivaceus]
MDNQNIPITDVDVRSHENNLAHRTREIDRERLIVRRGQPFSISLQCCDSLTRNHHLELSLHLGKKDEVVIKVHNEPEAGGKWWFNHQKVQDEILLTLHSPADAIIGEYHLTVLIKSPDGHFVKKTKNIGFHLLFNPWCKGESSLIIITRVIIHSYTAFYVEFSFVCLSQFEDYVMDICFQVLDNSKEALKNSKMDIEKRSDPVYVSRMITAMVNSNGDRGVLTGQWHEPYTGGFSPLRWTGSVPILRKWSKAEVRAVKYGQCWVFAAVACTVLRCLGIPTRNITNFNSAHDVDGNLSVDIVLNKEMESAGKKDSSWNFHCWIESWMRRDDLSKGNDGWQVLDPTPQELSDGEYCCGPCPVTAIKEGNLSVKYDAPFIFAEVNADIIYWMAGPGGERKKIDVDQSGVGKNISTKSLYGDYREDVTLHYKYPEGSKKEREVYQKAGHRIKEQICENKGPQQLQLSVKHGKPVFGTDFDVIVEVKNEGQKDTSPQLLIVVMAITYNSINQGECQRKATIVTVPARKTHKEVLRLRYDDYVKCVSEHHLIRVKALMEVPGDNKPVMSVANIPLSMPELLVEVPGSIIVQEKVTAFISFTNPLTVPLKRGMFTVEGSGLLSASEIYVKGDIAPGQKVSVKITFTPMRVGVRKLLVDFDSDRLKDVKGVTTVVVRKKSCFIRCP